MDKLRLIVVVLVVLTLSASFAASDVALQAALKTAQCRASCLNKVEKHMLMQEDMSCSESKECSACWETCNMEMTIQICNEGKLCSTGCQFSCDWDASHKSNSVPLSPHNSRLTLVFSGTRAHWLLAWAPDVPREQVVFNLFTRAKDTSWKLRLQTTNSETGLDDLLHGSEIKLVAVAESGVLSVIITVYEPSSQMITVVKPLGESSILKTSLENDSYEDIRMNNGEIWPLLYKAEVRESGLVVAHVWWIPMASGSGDYLVTWEVEGGGLKGHLYTDLPEVDLTLWPETIYHIQVELMRGSLGHFVQSTQLTLDTHNITATLYSKAEHEYERNILPQVQKESAYMTLVKAPKYSYDQLFNRYNQSMQIDVILGVVTGTGLAIIVIAVVICYKKRKAIVVTYDIPSKSSNKWGLSSLNLSYLAQGESLDLKNHSMPLCGRSNSTLNRNTIPPVFTLPTSPTLTRPLALHSMLTLSRPHQQIANICRQSYRELSNV